MSKRRGEKKAREEDANGAITVSPEHKQLEINTNKRHFIH